MVEIRTVQPEDQESWYRLDRHLPESEFQKKIRDRQGYVLLEHNKIIALLRYNLFWDNTPFCTLLFVELQSRGKGFGRRLMEHWANDMKDHGYGMVMVSTQVDEDAQNFYRKLGYQDCGGLTLDLPGYEQPMELFMVKAL